MKIDRTTWKRRLLASINCLPLWLRTVLHTLPIVAPLQRAVFKSLTTNTPIQPYFITAGPAKGLTLFLRLPDEKPYWKGTHELVVTQWLEGRCSQGDVCWDVGAHVGYDAAILSRKSGEPVYCFEPVPQNRERLFMQQQCNADVQFKVMPQALGDRTGTAEFLIGDGSTGKLSDSTFQPRAEMSGRIHISLTTIDHAVAMGLAPIPDLIKVDTEGAEFRVLNGGTSTLKRYHPRLLLEIHGCKEDDDLFRLLKTLDYRFLVLERHDYGTPLPGQHIWCEHDPS